MRINNSLRQLNATISRVSRQRSNLESRVSSLKQTLEHIFAAQENPEVKESLNNQSDDIRDSLEAVKQQIQRENSMALMARSSLQQQRVLRLLEGEGDNK